MNGSTYDTLVDLNNDNDLDDSITIPHPFVGDYKIRVVPKGTLFKVPMTYSVGIRIDGNDLSLLASNENTPPLGQTDSVTYKVLPFLKGDINRDQFVDIEDIVFLVNYVFYGGEEPDPIELGDTNCEDGASLTNIVQLINYVFYGGNRRAVDFVGVHCIIK